MRWWLLPLLAVMGVGAWYVTRWMDRKWPPKRSSNSTLDQYDELHALTVQGVTPMLPRPDWGQDVGYVAFCLDALLAYRRIHESHRLLCPTCLGTKRVVFGGIAESWQPCPENGGECDGLMTEQRAWNIVAKMLAMKPAAYGHAENVLEELRGTH